MFESYRYAEKPPLDCPISVFGGKQDPLVTRDDLFAWSRHAQGDFKLTMLPGDHASYITQQQRLLTMVGQELLAGLGK